MYDRIPELRPPQRILLGPGPSNMDFRVYRALMTPVLGHLDYKFLEIMDEVQTMLRHVFVTTNKLTIPVSGTGSAGMEAAMVNFIEEGDEVIVCVAGHFGARMAEMAERARARLIRIEAPPGSPVELERVRDATRGKKIKMIAMVHGETSTGVAQDIAAMCALADECGALLAVDAVATLGGMPLKTDALGADVVYTGSQKCLSAPPGLAPITVSPRGQEVLRARRSKVQSWYLDLTMVEKYWGKDRTYHHTAPISMVYALHEALRIVEEEGLEARWERHQRNQQALVAGLEAMGLELLVPLRDRMWTVSAVKVPAGVEEARLRRRLLDEYNIEIAGGLGELKGKIWRIGLMGTSCTPNNVLLLLSVLEKVLQDENVRIPAGAGVAAAERIYSTAREGAGARA
jgi:alanine-glyoxylate transaminase/serine-glyoxylate transaminase/serine-pyruvate transaminase